VTEDWDNSMINIRYICKSEQDWLNKKVEEAKQAQQVKGKAKAPAKGTEVKEEKPSFDLNEPCDIAYEEVKPEQNVKTTDNVRNLQLMINARCDEVEIQASLDTIKFKPTMMYTTRSYYFTLTNPKSIAIEYSMVMKDEADIIGFNPFSTDNEYGSIEPNSQVNITLKFNPTEV